MRLRHTLLAATLLATPFALAGQGRAQPISGVYIGAGAGGNVLQQERVLASPGLALSAKRLSTQVGGVGVGSIGYGFGNGLRLEVEGDVRHNRVHKIDGFTSTGTNPTASGGDQFSYSGMVNALFDLDIGQNWLYPYFGVGAGIADTYLYNLHSYGTRGGLTNIVTGAPLAFQANVNGWSTNFAYQGIFGLGFPLAAVPGLSLTAEYRFFRGFGCAVIPWA